MSRSHPITHALRAGVQEGVFPGAVLLVRLHNTILYHEAVGLASSLPAATAARLNTLYDLASLTKPLATATAILCLVQDGLAHLDQPVGSILPTLMTSSVSEATIRDLLGHRSGLPAWRPYFKQFGFQEGKWREQDSLEKRREFVLHKICHEPLEDQPRDQTLYSDLGFMLLGFVIESKTNQSLGRYCKERIFDPLSAKSLSFLQSEGEVSPGHGASCDIAPTEQDPWRGRLAQGEVHDENAYLLGGIAGHAGLFGTAGAVAAITGAWLGGYWGRNAFFDQNLVNEFVAKQPGSSWALGWDTPSLPSSSGTRLSQSAFGHLGFTGTSVWIDPIPELEVILLSNRVHPTRDNNKIKDFRPMIHDLVYQEFVGNG
ncbi:MAG: serine hydrolase [Nitrospirota bacterium]|nr:MAG: serine hydrolase [Nitrospirota bacterium]